MATVVALVTAAKQLPPVVGGASPGVPPRSEPTVTIDNDKDKDEVKTMYQQLRLVVGGASLGAPPGSISLE